MNPIEAMIAELCKTHEVICKINKEQTFVDLYIVEEDGSEKHVYRFYSQGGAI